MASSWVFLLGLLALCNAAADDFAGGEVYVRYSFPSDDPTSPTCSIEGNGVADFWQEGVTHARSTSMIEQGKVLVTQYLGDLVNCCVVDEAVLQMVGVDPCKTTYECPEGFTMFGEHCYYFSDKRASWWDAQDACLELNVGASLVRPYTKEIDEFVLSYVNVTAVNWWNDISCTSSSSLGLGRIFQYSNGEDLTYLNWSRNNPNNGGRNCLKNCDEKPEKKNCKKNCDEQCGMYWAYKGRNFSWNDANCDKKNKYVCQMERTPVYSDYDTDYDATYPDYEPVYSDYEPVYSDYEPVYSDYAYMG